jgi:short-subunit dehydrogenase
MSLNPPLADWRGRRVWLVGASSGIGEATAHALHAAGAQVVVSARNAAALDRFAQTHTGAQALPLDVSDPAAIRSVAQALLQAGPVDMVMYCAGIYKPVRAEAYALADMLQHQQVNYVGLVHLLDVLLPYFVARRSGHLCIVSSVAGYRGLPKSLAYGPTKAALINLAETLYLDLHAYGIGVSLINPGFVQTPATAQNDFTMPALITSEQAAKEILAGWQQGSFEIHFPKRFTLLMKAMRWLPYTAYFAMTRRLVKNETAGNRQEGPQA